jgi:hypothetical protein
LHDTGVLEINDELVGEEIMEEKADEKYLGDIIIYPRMDVI